MHMSIIYIPEKLTPRRGIFENGYINIEWQKTNGRPPFYHQNQDCDEIAYRTRGERSVLSELGTVDVQPGEILQKTCRGSAR